MPAEHVALVRELLEAAREVRVPRVLRRDPQRHLLAAARDPDRDPALLQRLGLQDRAVDPIVLPVEGRGARRPGLVHDLHALAEPREPLGHGRETVPVGAPLLLVPAAADAHLDASTRDHVDRRGDLREIGRVAVAHARAHLAEAYARGARGVRRHQRPSLVGRLGPTRHGHRVEVVVHPDRVPRAGVGPLRDAAHRLPVLCRVDADQVVTPALGNEHSESHGCQPKPRMQLEIALSERHAYSSDGCRNPLASHVDLSAGTITKGLPVKQLTATTAPLIMQTVRCYHDTVVKLALVEFHSRHARKSRRR